MSDSTPSLRRLEASDFGSAANAHDFPLRKANDLRHGGTPCGSPSPPAAQTVEPCAISESKKGPVIYVHVNHLR